MAISPDLRSLLEKLDALELSEGERAAFGQLLGVAPQSDDVEGFASMDVIRVQGFDLGIGDPRRAGLFDTLTKNATLGTAGPGRGVVDHKADD